VRTESASARYDGLDGWPTDDVVQALFESQMVGLAAIRPALPLIAAAADAIAARLAGSGGRLLYAGAGTSGRIGAQDGAELPPTFDWPDARVGFLMAGGSRALTQAVEGAEDDASAGRGEIERLAVGPDDTLIGVAASGTTPFTIAAITAARAAGCLTVGVANNPDSPLLAAAEHPLVVDTGPEVVAGSTRLKAGTAQKVVLNLLSTAAMVRLGRVYRGQMVEMRATNAKLRRRSVAMLAHLVPTATEAAIEAALALAGGRIKPAMLVLRSATAGEAEELLAAAGGNLRRALELLDARRLSEIIGDGGEDGG
jgi:N-acetylmuramic acid 6-phosphate etherase